MDKAPGLLKHDKMVLRLHDFFAPGFVLFCESAFSCRDFKAEVPVYVPREGKGGKLIRGMVCGFVDCQVSMKPNYATDSKSFLMQFEVKTRFSEVSEGVRQLKKYRHNTLPFLDTSNYELRSVLVTEEPDDPDLQNDVLKFCCASDVMWWPAP